MKHILTDLNNKQAKIGLFSY